ncbi:MAG: NrdH-redoxin [Chloroflexi bacterium]|nr:NrdH-redoxin [Chloroflexota bacterium]
MAAKTDKKKKQKKVLIFTTPTCGWCKRAMKYFREHNVKYKQVDVSRDPAAARDMVRMSGQMGVPVIKIGKEVIVGFDKARIDQLLDLRKN